MSRELSRNERRLAALAAIGLLWGALLVAIGFAVPFVALVVGGLLLVAALWLQGRVLAGTIGPRAAKVGGRLRAATRTASARAARVDWAGRRAAAGTVASRMVARARDARVNLAARTVAPAAEPGRRQALRLNEQAAALRHDGRAGEAVELVESALQIFRRLGDRRGEALTLNGLGLTQARIGDEAGAIDSYEAAVAILAELGDSHGAGRVLANLGSLHRGQGDEEQARATWTDALERLEPGSPEHDRTAQQLELAS